MQEDSIVQPSPPAQTECKQNTFEFLDLIKRKVVIESHDQHISSDAGGLLIAQLDRNEKWLEKFTNCFTDYRIPELVEHELPTLLWQRVYGIALGYEDLNDHDLLRLDPLLATLCGRDDVEGKERREEQDYGKPLAGKSTLNRLELSAQNIDPRYKKIACDSEAVEDFFIDAYVQSVPRKSESVILDLDTTDDRIHGLQEGRFYHGHYKDYCYLPLYIFGGDFPVVSQLRTSESEHQEDTVRLVKKLLTPCASALDDAEIVFAVTQGQFTCAVTEGIVAIGVVRTLAGDDLIFPVTCVKQVIFKHVVGRIVLLVAVAITDCFPAISPAPGPRAEIVVIDAVVIEVW
jgi:hypothetical protein